MLCNLQVLSGSGHCVHIVVKSHEPFIREELRLHCKEGSMLAESVQHRHQGITLLSPFALPDFMCGPMVVVP